MGIGETILERRGENGLALKLGFQRVWGRFERKGVGGFLKLIKQAMEKA